MATNDSVITCGAFTVDMCTGPSVPRDGSAALERFSPAEVTLYAFPVPAWATQLGPSIEIRRMTPHPDHTVHRAATAEHPTCHPVERVLHAAKGRARPGTPTLSLAVEPCVRQQSRHMNGWIPVLAGPPASGSTMRCSPPALNRLASTHPAEPPPTTM